MADNLVLVQQARNFVASRVTHAYRDARNAALGRWAATG